jgi:hypothetical protein
VKPTFILPGHVIRLNRPGTLANTLAAIEGKRWAFQLSGVLTSGLTELPKGTTLTVSQIYFRKSGYYENSISFKIKTPAVLDALTEAVVKEEIAKTKKQLDWTTPVFEAMNRGKADVLVKKYDVEKDAILDEEILIPSPLTPDEQYKEADKWHRTNAGGLKEAISVFTGKKVRPAYRYTAYCRCHIEAQHNQLTSRLSALEARDPKAVKAIRTTLAKSSFRFRLTDIQEWDITIMEMDEKAAKAPF